MSETKEIFFGDDAREKLLEGITLAFQAIKHTFGSDHKTTLIHHKNDLPLRSSGLEILSALSLTQESTHVGLLSLLEPIRKMNDVFGDGTKLCTILTGALFKYIFQAIERGEDPLQLKESLDEAFLLIMNVLNRLKKPLETDLELYQIALNGSFQNQKIAETLMKAFQKVGHEGTISIDSSCDKETHIEKFHGLEIPQGLLSSYFITDLEAQESKLKNVKILITDQEISSSQDLLPILQEMTKSKEPLLIIAEDITGEALSTLLVNKLRGTLSLAAIKIKEMNIDKHEFLEDLAIYTNATLIADEKGIPLKKATSSCLGFADLVILKQEKTSIIQGGGDKEKIRQRAASLRARALNSSDPIQKEFLFKRADSLVGDVCLISVGEGESLKAYDSSLKRVKAALQGGFLPGGATSFLFAKEALSSFPHKTIKDLLEKVLDEPSMILIENAGLNPHLIKETILKKGFGFGLNTRTGEVENFFSSGIIDPFVIISQSFEYALSIATLMALSEVMIVSEET